MKEKYIVAGSLFVCCAAIVWLLAVKGFNKSTKVLGKQEQANLFIANFDSIISKAKQNLSDIEKAYLTEQTQIAKDNDTAQAIGATRVLVKFWDSLQRFDISGFYYSQLNDKIPSEFFLMNASQRFYEQGRVVADSAARKFYFDKANSGFKKVLEQNANNLDAKVGIALCIIENRDRIMEGVPMLRQVLTIDSNHLLANYTLGLLQIESGQLQKALVSFEKLVSLQPFNGEYYFYLADVYQKMGKRELAIKNYEKAKLLAPNKETKQAIDDILKNI